MDRVAAVFHEQFANWGLELPAAILRKRRSGFIQSQGWLIQYAFGRNRFGEYVDYYASHRMTNDRHVRLYVSGRRQHLAALASMYPTSEDPKKAARAEAAYLRRNRRIARSLVDKGFSKFTINMALQSGFEDDCALSGTGSRAPRTPSTRLRPTKPGRRRKSHSRGKRSPRLRG